MKKTLLMLVGCTALAMAAELATVHLPFASQVGQTMLPAGEYTVRTLDNGGSSTVIALDGANGVHAAVPAKRVPQAGPGSADLKFVRSPTGLKLSQILRRRAGLLLRTGTVARPDWGPEGRTPRPPLSPGSSRTGTRLGAESP